jgi:hypothetical protein
MTKWKQLKKWQKILIGVPAVIIVWTIIDLFIFQFSALILQADAECEIKVRGADLHNSYKVNDVHEKAKKAGLKSQVDESGQWVSIDTAYGDITLVQHKDYYDANYWSVYAGIGEYNDRWICTTPNWVLAMRLRNSLDKLGIESDQIKAGSIEKEYKISLW